MHLFSMALLFPFHIKEEEICNSELYFLGRPFAEKILLSRSTYSTNVEQECRRFPSLLNQILFQIRLFGP